MLHLWDWVSYTIYDSIIITFSIFSAALISLQIINTVKEKHVCIHIPNAEP